MGLLDRLINSAIDAAANKLDEKLQNTIENKFGGNKKEYTLPEEFSFFPKYEGTIVNGPERKSTEKYERITVFFEGLPNNEYISQIQENGFYKASDVRYEKGNTYIIVDTNRGYTKIAYHIKK